jgi:hypothetical protein
MTPRLQPSLFYLTIINLQQQQEQQHRFVDNTSKKKQD